MQQITATSRLVGTTAATRLLALSLLLRSVAAAKFCCSDTDFHVTREDLLQPVAATCRSDLSHSVSRPLNVKSKHLQFQCFNFVQMPWYWLQKLRISSYDHTGRYSFVLGATQGLP